MAKDDQVSLRYSAEGSHDGEPYKGKYTAFSIHLDFYFHLGIKATGRKAKWTAAGLFKLENGKITL
jgi:hypothetical protein